MAAPLFPNLPSVNDLLQSEPLKYLAERLSKNVVVDGVRTFLDRLQTEARTAARDLELPTPAELASRIANWLRSEGESAARPAINATGDFFSRDLSGPPLADAALARINALGRSYSLAPPDAADEAAAVERLLAETAGCEASFVASSHAAAKSLAELAGFAFDRPEKSVVDAGPSTIIDGTEYGLPPEANAFPLLKDGVKLVLLRGDGYLGGAPCGILLGASEAIEKVAEHPLAAALRAGRLTLAALDVTLRIARDPVRAREEIPILALASTGVANLKHRAERLALQLAASPAVASAEAQENLEGGSWRVLVTPQSESAEELAARLRSNSPAIVARCFRDRIAFDLRTILARQDIEIVRVFDRLEGMATA